MESKLSLYGIAEELKTLDQLLIADYGELSEESEALGEHIGALLATKTDGCVGWIRRQEDLIEAARKRILELQFFQKAREAGITRFETYIKNALAISGREKFEGALYRIGLRKPAQILKIEDDNRVPPEFISVETLIKIDRAELKRAVKAGLSIEGIRLIEGETSILVGMKK